MLQIEKNKTHSLFMKIYWRGKVFSSINFSQIMHLITPCYAWLNTGRSRSPAVCTGIARKCMQRHVLDSWWKIKHTSSRLKQHRVVTISCRIYEDSLEMGAATWFRIKLCTMMREHRACCSVEPRVLPRVSSLFGGRSIFLAIP